MSVKNIAQLAERIRKWEFRRFGGGGMQIDGKRGGCGQHAGRDWEGVREFWLALTKNRGRRGTGASSKRTYHLHICSIIARRLLNCNFNARSQDAVEEMFSRCPSSYLCCGVVRNEVRLSTAQPNVFSTSTFIYFLHSNPAFNTHLPVSAALYVALF